MWPGSRSGSPASSAPALGGLGIAAGYGRLGLTAGWIGVTGSVLWLIPGLLLAGAGIGLVVAPLLSIVLARVAPEHASAASGVLTAAQQGGAAVGVAVVGLVFYRALAAHPGAAAYAPAFGHSEYLLAGSGPLVAVLTQLLPRTRRG